MIMNNKVEKVLKGLKLAGTVAGVVLAAVIAKK